MTAKKFTPPPFVVVAGHRIKVQVIPDMEDWGSYHNDKKVIRISESAKDKDFTETLRHEMMHAALRISGLAWADKMEEEAVVRCMDEVFFPAWERIRHRLP